MEMPNQTCNLKTIKYVKSCWEKEDIWGTCVLYMCIVFSVRGMTVTSSWARWRPKSPVSPLFTQPFIQTQNKEIIKARRHWPLCGEFTGGRWIPRTNGQWHGKCFHLMTLPWGKFVWNLWKCQQVYDYIRINLSFIKAWIFEIWKIYWLFKRQLVCHCLWFWWFFEIW